jgi:hypothetical protein
MLFKGLIILMALITLMTFGVALSSIIEGNGLDGLFLLVAAAWFGSKTYEGWRIRGE